MFKKTISTILIFALALVMVACSAFANLGSGVPSTAPSTASETGDALLESKLAAGILKLESTELAVTRTQANAMLLLWQGVQALTRDKTSSALELAALYQQFSAALTAEQTEAIRALSWSQEELSAWLQSAGGSTAQASATTRKTSASTSSGQEQMPGGGMGGPGGGGSSDLALISGMSMPSTGAAQATATPVKTSTTSSQTVNLNAQLATAVIDLLQKRAAS